MAGPAEVVGRCFGKLPPLSAYRYDLIGSLLGICAFTALSFLHAPSVAWGFIAFILYLVLASPSRRLVTCAWALMLVGKLLQETLAPGVSWSPYYKVATKEAGVRGLEPAPHQRQRRAPPVDGPREVEVGGGRRNLRTPYLRLPGNPLDDVLIIGAGSGSDVAIALSKQARHVDAVDIDPRILQIGVEQNPDRPYADQRVTMHVERRAGIPGKHGPQIRPDPFRAARLADAGQRRLADPARVVPVHRRKRWRPPATT